jgi:hypothetical protein
MLVPRKKSIPSSRKNWGGKGTPTRQSTPLSFPLEGPSLAFVLAMLTDTKRRATNATGR